MFRTSIKITLDVIKWAVWRYFYLWLQVITCSGVCGSLEQINFLFFIFYFFFLKKFPLKSCFHIISLVIIWHFHCWLGIADEQTSRSWYHWDDSRRLQRTQTIAELTATNTAVCLLFTWSTSWHSQPYTRGTYTAMAVGASQIDIERIAQPLYANPQQKKVSCVFISFFCTSTIQLVELINQSTCQYK